MKSLLDPTFIAVIASVLSVLLLAACAQMFGWIV